MLEDPRFSSNEARMENLKVLEQHLNNKLPARTTNAWLDLFEQAGVPAGPINTIVQMHDDPQRLWLGKWWSHNPTLTRGPSKHWACPLNSKRTPGPKNNHPPLRSTTRSILRGAGYTDEEISTFIQGGVTVAEKAV
ncbi:MAG: hypothetical protein Ct9H300mP14_14660 [Gammaproteobacteria bacterium]|nr:MAG: hypothetical protein Ct9H300mP14_14660 [Gammaproteobacteria bacterium]